MSAAVQLITKKYPMNNLSYIIAILLFLLTGSARGEEVPAIRVMTFNIRMDNPEDSLNQWTNRKDFACDMIRFHCPDVIGAQEVLHHQLVDMQQRLPEYASVGVGREDGKELGEYSAVFYRKDRFELLIGQTFWLSEYPDSIGRKGWDAACERVVTWAKLRDRTTGQVFYFFNTHFDHMGRIARRESCTLLKNKVSAIAGNTPVVVTGDFNAPPRSAVITAITDPTDSQHLMDSRSVADFRYGPEYSFHDYGKLPPERLDMIDFIFIKHVQKVLLSAVITDTRGPLYVSDHYPVIAVIRL